MARQRSTPLFSQHPLPSSSSACPNHPAVGRDGGAAVQKQRSSASQKFWMIGITVIFVYSYFVFGKLESLMIADMKKTKGNDRSVIETDRTEAKEGPVHLGGSSMLARKIFEDDTHKARSTTVVRPSLTNQTAVERSSTARNQTTVVREKISPLVSEAASDRGIAINANAPTTKSPYRKWAYAFLIAGCDPKNVDAYIGYIYNVIVATHVLKTSGSVADVIVMVQMSYDSNSEKLPNVQEDMLTSVGAKIKYIPKPVIKESFYTVIMEKLRTIDLVEYSRALLLDSDVMPFCNLDYIFEMSEPLAGPATIKENLVLGWRTEPANAGFFMLKPEVGGWDKINRIIEERIKRDYRELPEPPHFSEERGWGHIMKAPKDYARLFSGEKLNIWKWHCVIADQGLLYYWVKYVKKSVTTVTDKLVENWSAATAEDVKRDPTLTLGEVFVQDANDPFKGKSCVKREDRRRHASFSSVFKMNIPHADFVHFTGNSKPWEQPISYVIKDVTKARKPAEFWFYILGVLKEKLDNPHLNSINIANITKMERVLGGYPAPKTVDLFAENLLKKSTDANGNNTES